MKERYLFSESVSESHPDKMACHLPRNQQDILSFIGPESHLIADYVKTMNCKTLNGDQPEHVFGCLKLLYEIREPETDVVIIDNSCLISQMILLNSKTDCFYFGIDQNGILSSNGVFPAQKIKGNNVSIVNDRIVIIINTIERANKFKDLFDHLKDNPAQNKAYRFCNVKSNQLKH